MVSLRSRARGALYGTLLGDALGRPFEGASLRGAERRVAALRQRQARPRALLHSDDGEMMLSLMEGLLAEACPGARLAPDRVLHYLAEGHEPARGYGKGARAAFRVYRQGGSYGEAARALWPEGSRGNGAAVRVAPIALWMRSTDEEETANAARASAIPTHAHPAAIHGAVGVALVLRRLLEGATRDAATAALEGWEDLACGSPDLSPQEAYEQYGHGVVIEETVPAAVWAFLGARSFDGALARVVALGGDTDSIGAIVGAFAGAHFGFEAIRPVCVDALEKTACATVERFIERLARR